MTNEIHELKAARNAAENTSLKALSALEESLQSAELTTPVRTNIMSYVSLVKEQTLRRHRILGIIQDALSDLRVDVRYLVFDLEATRRELAAAREELARYKGE